LIKVGIILTPDNRSKSYIQKIIKEKIKLEEIIFMNKKSSEQHYSAKVIDESKRCGFDISEPVSETLKKQQLDYVEFNFVDINHPQLIKFLEKSKTNYFIYTGGGILKNPVLRTGSKFIHFHPGIVPKYRGSTCFYYSIINDDKCGVTAYFMDEKLDTGDIIFQKNFPKPENEFIDEVYDSHIRSETLLEVIKNNLIGNKNLKKQNPSEGENYFIIHPVLKHIAILSCIKK